MLIKQKLFVCFIASLSLLICANCQSQAMAEQKQIESLSALSWAEERIFFQEYGHDAPEVRLSRLEKRIFGEVMVGEDKERISKLISTLEGQIDPDGLEVSSKRAAISTSTLADLNQAVVKPQLNAQPKGPDDPDEQACAIERARVSVQAAKEEEIRTLLAEGVDLWRQKRGQEALEKFEQVVRLDGQNAEANFSMGIIEETTGNLVEALSSYRVALSCRPKCPDYEHAIAAVEKKLAAKDKLDGKQLETHKLAEDAIYAYKRGEYLSALDLYKRLDQKSPGQHLVKYNLGTVYLVIHQPEKALEYYQQARKLDPQNEKYNQACRQLVAAMNKDAQPDKQPGQVKESQALGYDKRNLSAFSQNLMANYGILGKSASSGVVITTVGIASRASQLGIQRGDIIRAVDGMVVKHPNEVNEILSRKNPGESIKLVIQRENSLAQVAL